MNKPVAALIYDFDNTLCTKDMQEYGFIPSIGMSAVRVLEAGERFDRPAADGQHPGLYVPDGAEGQRGKNPHYPGNLPKAGGGYRVF